MPFTLVILEAAHRDIDITFGWIKRTTGTASAVRWRRGLAQKFRLLEADPHRFPEAQDAAGLGIDLREILHGKRPHIHRILFTLDGRTVHVHRVWHAAKDWVTEGDLLPPEA